MSETLVGWGLLATSLMSVVWLALLGGLTGVLSMLLYAKTSPQSRVTELSEQAGEARLALSRFDGDDIHEVLLLTKRAVGLSLRQIRLMLGPMLLAGVLVLGAAWLVAVVFDLSRVNPGPTWAPSWLCSGHAAFWIPLTVGAMCLKWILKIK